MTLMTHGGRPRGGLQRLGRALAAVAAGAMLVACGGGGGDAGGNGTLRLALTDAPSCGYDSVFVTVEKVRVHRSAAAGENDAGWAEIALPQPRRVDLLTLTNGVLEELGQTALPAGKYTQLRLVLVANGGSTPMANALTPTGAAETALTTPSGQQSGLKANIDLDVEAGKLADFVLDFKVCESIVRRGNSGQFNLKPVLALLPRMSDAGARVVGYVGAGLDPATTVISVQQGGVPVRATPPAVGGQFVLAQLPEGSYDLVVQSQGRVTALVTGVPVVASGVTTLNTETTRIDPPTALKPRTATGTVATGITPVDATVRVLKAYTGGPTVELGAVPADATTGAFSFALAGDAPLRASYTPGMAALVFNADPATPTGRYTLQARSGMVSKETAIDLSGANASSAITLP